VEFTQVNWSRTEIAILHSPQPNIVSSTGNHPVKKTKPLKLIENYKGKKLIKGIVCLKTISLDLE